MADRLTDVASKLDAQITKMIGGRKPSPTQPATDTKESAMPSGVLEILKAGGCTDAEGTLAEIEAAGFKIEKSGAAKPPKDDMGAEMKEDAAADLGADIGADLAKMPMKDARNGAAKMAFESMGK